MNTSDILRRIALGERVSQAEAKQLANEYAEAVNLLSQLRSYLGTKRGLRVDWIDSNLLEVSGDFTAYGGDVNSNILSTTDDPHMSLQTQYTTRGMFWYDQSLGNIVVENNESGKPIVLNTNGGVIYIYNDATGLTPFGLNSATGGLEIKMVTAEPAYVDGYTILYYYSGDDGKGGTLYELRSRTKIGATETQKTIVILSP